MKKEFMERVFFLTALISVLCIFLISLFLIINGLPIFKEVGFRNFILGKDWSPKDLPATYGILPMILGSIYVTLGAIIIGVPIGILTAIYIVFYAPKKIQKPLRSMVNLMAGIPSIIYGFFGLAVLVPFIRNVFGGTGNSILTAAILLGIMILPTIINISMDSLNSVPSSYYQGALALGSSKERALMKVVVPASKSGMISGVILGIGRAIGETMAVVMVAGNNARMPKGLLKGVRTLTTNIVFEMGYAEGVHRDALIGTALVLFVFILLINLWFTLFKRRMDNE